MFSLRRAAVAAVVVSASLAAYASAEAAPYITRASWEAAVTTFAAVDISGIPENTIGFAGTVARPFGGTMSFGAPLDRFEFPTSWQTWSGLDPIVEVLFTAGTSITATFSGAVMAFGLEMQPNEFAIHSMTMLLDDATSITQNVDGNGGALFFGWAGQSITSFTLSCLTCTNVIEGTGFAFGQMVEGQIATTPSVDEPATLALFGLGLAGLAFARRRKIA